MWIWFPIGAIPIHSPPDDLYVEDIEAPCGQPVLAQQFVTKVHIQNIPPEFRNVGLQYYLEKVMKNKVSCAVEFYHMDGIATFDRPIGTFAHW